MAEGQLKRVQPDLVEEVENCEGGSFSEKMRAWRLQEVENTLESVENLTGSDKSLTVSDLQEALDERLGQIKEENSGGVNNSFTVDDLDDVFREVLRDEVPEILRRVT